MWAERRNIRRAVNNGCCVFHGAHGTMLVAVLVLDDGGLGVIAAEYGVT